MEVVRKIVRATQNKRKHYEPLDDSESSDRNTHW